MDSEEAWWLEPRLQALRTDASLLPPRELLWTTLVEACPSFGPHWEPQEEFWVTVDRFAEHLASEWAEHRDAAQVKQIFDAIERALSDQKRRREVSAILEAIRDHLRRRRLPVTDFEPFLGPVTSSAWRRLL